MTRKDALKQGLFVKVNDMADELCTSLGIPFVFGLPNQNNRPILEKYAGWQTLNVLQVCSVPVAGLPWGKLAQRLPVFRSIHSAFAERRLKQKEGSKQLTRSQWDGHLRNAAYYEYKQAYSNHYMLQLQHGLAWVKCKSALFLGDVELAAGSEFEELLAELKSLTRSLGLSELVWMGSQGLEETSLLAEHYPLIQGNAVCAKSLAGALPDLSKLRFTYGDYDSF